MIRLCTRSRDRWSTNSQANLELGAERLGRLPRYLKWLNRRWAPSPRPRGWRSTTRRKLSRVPRSIQAVSHDIVVSLLPALAVGARESWRETARGAGVGRERTPLRA